MVAVVSGDAPDRKAAIDAYLDSKFLGAATLRRRAIEAKTQGFLERTDMATRILEKRHAITVLPLWLVEVLEGR